MKERHTKQYAEIGLKIADSRKFSGLTQEELAEKIGKSWSFVAQVESVKGKTGISLDTLFDIATVLNTDPYKFLKND